MKEQLVKVSAAAIDNPLPTAARKSPSRGSREGLRALTNS
jgi:hypothetical protein